MKVCYLAHIRLPTEKAHGAQIMKTCEALAGEDASVTLLTPGRKTPVGADPFSYYDAKKNFSLVSLNTPDFIPLGPLGFALSLLWFSEVAKWRKEFWEADVIYSRDAFVLLQYVLLGRKLVYEAHMKPTMISKFVARKAYRVVAISHALKEAYVRFGVAQERIIVASDAVDPEPFTHSYDGNAVREELGIPLDKKVALYVGKIDEAKGVPTFAAASEYLPPHIVAVVIGGGVLKESLADRFPKALFLPETIYRDLARVLSAADVLILPNSAKDKDASMYTSPLKAFAYLASRKPIVASAVPALQEILMEHAVFFEPDNPQGLASAIQEALQVPVSSQSLDFSWESRARRILSGL